PRSSACGVRVTPPVAEGACAIPLPVRLQSLAVGADDIRFTAEPTLDCRLAERLADWIGNVVEPLARHHLGSGLAAMRPGRAMSAATATTKPPARLASTPKATPST